MKKEVKTDSEKIDIKAKAIIESLSDEDAKKLLAEKWITPLVSGLEQLANSTVDEFVKQLKKTVEKYDETLLDLDKKIAETSNSLADMIDDLTGNDFDMKGLKELQSILRRNNE